LEKSRVTLQNQFDSWYNALHARDGQILSTSTQQSRSSYADRTSVTVGGNSASSSAENDLKQRHSSSENNAKRASERPSSSAGLESPRGGSTTDRSRKHREAEERNKKLGSSSQSNVTDSDGEDEVNEDIMAFYKAKEELLKRRGG
jgi:hypothetical protein